MLSRWKSDKGKFKAVFKLQFQATQVPQLKKGKGLMISLIPADVGKPTVRLEKAAVLEGNCSWENPIYETVKLVKEQKTGLFKEKLYYFNVSTGSSKTGFLGEVGVDFADLAETTEALTISLPLVENSNSCPILHVTLGQVTIQKMQGTEDLRPVEAGDSPRDESMGRRLEYQMSNSDRDENYLDSTEEEQFNRGNAIGIEQNSNFGEFQSSNGTYQEFEARGKNSLQRNKTVDTFPTEKHVHRKTSTDWSVGSASDGSLFDLTNSPEANFPRNGLPETSNSSTETLKSEIRRLERQAEVSDLELQSLRKQIGKENKRVQDLIKQNISLKEEKDALGTECEVLQSSQKTYIELAEEEASKLRLVLEEVMRELQHEKSLNNTLSMRVQKTEDSNSELILVVKDLDLLLEEKDTEISHLSNKVKDSETANELKAEAHQKEQIKAKEVDVLKQKIEDMKAEIEIHVRENERISMDYELSKQERIAISSKLKQCQIEQIKLQNEYSESLAATKDYQLQVQRLEERITKQALEFSESLDLINELESQVKSLEIELEKQRKHFEDDLEALTITKSELEQRVIKAEEALKKTKLRNVDATEHLQEEVRRLSLEMTSKFDENEKMAMEAASEAQGLRLQIGAFEEKLKEANKELLLTKEQYVQEVHKLLSQTNLQAKQIEQMSLELDEKRVQVEEYKKEKDKAFSIKNQTQEAPIDKKMEKNDYSEKKEPNGKLREKIKQMKTSAKETQQWVKQREELERELVSVRKEAEKIKEESVTLKSLNDEKAVIVSTLQSEMKRLQANYDELKQCMSEGKSEKVENSQQMKEELTSSIQNKTALLPNSAKNAIRSPEHLKLNKEHKGAPQTTNSITTKGTLKKKSVTAKGERTKGRCTEEEQRVSTSHSGDDFNLIELSAEVKSLNDRNKKMEDELREMQEKYSEISLKFAEVEGERQQLALNLRNLKNGRKN